MEAYLVHHGVKGMKWGVRHASAKKFAKASKKFAKNPTRRNSKRMNKAARNFELQQKILMTQNKDALEYFARGYKIAKYYGLKTETLKKTEKKIRGMLGDAYKPIAKDEKYKDRGETFIGQILDGLLKT